MDLRREKAVELRGGLCSFPMNASLEWPEANGQVGEMLTEQELVDRAVRQLGVRRTFRRDGRTITLACLIRDDDQRPLRASWWKGKEVTVIAVDLDGNFLLRHSGGSVRIWDHRAQAETVVAPSVREFVEALE